jgi:hypothetical protein
MEKFYSLSASGQPQTPKGALVISVIARSITTKQSCLDCRAMLAVTPAFFKAPLGVWGNTIKDNKLKSQKLFVKLFHGQAHNISIRAFNTFNANISNPFLYSIRT